MSDKTTMIFYRNESVIKVGWPIRWFTLYINTNKIDLFMGQVKSSLSMILTHFMFAQARSNLKMDLKFYLSSSIFINNKAIFFLSLSILFSKFLKYLNYFSTLSRDSVTPVCKFFWSFCFYFDLIFDWYLVSFKLS